MRAIRRHYNSAETQFHYHTNNPPFVVGDMAKRKKRKSANMKLYKIRLSALFKHNHKLLNPNRGRLTADMTVYRGTFYKAPPRWKQSESFARYIYRKYYRKDVPDQFANLDELRKQCAWLQVVQHYKYKVLMNIQRRVCQGPPARNIIEFMFGHPPTVHSFDLKWRGQDVDVTHPNYLRQYFRSIGFTAPADGYIGGSN